MNRCHLCPRHCQLEEGQIGYCKARIMLARASKPLAYGKLTALALDPIEKKPLSMFHPGKRILSVGSFGCNMSCYFCQNYGISRAGTDDSRWQEFSPDVLCALAIELVPKGNIGIAFTYNEPMLNAEFVSDCADKLKEKALKTVVITNGNFCIDAVGNVIKKVDAFNIDLKGFSNSWYRKLGGDFDTVKAFIQEACKTAHVEITTLVVPGQNDSPEEIDELARWLAYINPDIPLHLSRYFPRYKALDAPTDKQALFKLADIVRQYLNNVFVGNV
ncbi:MAG: AmmeMemoRadiSam system radical SAM enzyme [Christensenellaceae bacterium]|nr:AmmeMemoRadiSam system radical SAM enzyme [Christensenellaceae bacterium]